MKGFLWSQSHQLRCLWDFKLEISLSHEMEGMLTPLTVHIATIANLTELILCVRHFAKYSYFKYVASFNPHSIPMSRYYAVLCLVTQSYPTLCDPMDCRLPDSSVSGIFQARIVEWVAMPSSRESAWPRDWTRLSWVFCIASGFFTAKSLGKPIEGRTHQSMWSYKSNVTLFEVVGESSGEVIEATGNL